MSLVLVLVLNFETAPQGLPFQMSIIVPAFWQSA